MTHQRSLPHSWLLLVAATTSLALAGCGDDDSANGVATSVPPIVSNATTVAVTQAPTVGLPVIDDDDPRYLSTIVTGAGGGVVVTRLDGSDVVRLATDVPGVHKHANWSPEGDSVVFVDDETETVWIAHLDGSPSEAMPGCDNDGCDYPAFSPDGSKIAYSRYENASGVTGPAAVGIEILDLASGEVIEVVRLERPLLADVPRWSPDGTQLVIGVDQMDDAAVETGAAVAVVPITGGELTYLTEFPLFGYAPDWNSLTGEIVFGTAVREYAADVQPDESWDVWAVQPDGTGLRQITHSAPGELIRGAKWTPDGLRILANSNIEGMVTIDPSTGDMTSISGTSESTTSPRLRPGNQY